jgi:hypothetical protein
LDSNGDAKVSREEIYSWFQANKQNVAASIHTQLTSSFDSVDKLTNHPIQFWEGGDEYYHSSADFKLNYSESEAFCSNWGGTLFEEGAVVGRL